MIKKIIDKIDRILYPLNLNFDKLKILEYRELDIYDLDQTIYEGKSIY
ncbi:hypothetical protein SAMN04487907_1011102 [Zunongwangia mangrovi]|uniref:Uncharacterized protein n=1 Tax=Zunongwangia mangrovi TaxID=1334022 RepID=A0A1I1EYX3_9FLAO|nr:hypothetical protein SAMN04487907_1011102 [Zunongwangia mangrovi]